MVMPWEMDWAGPTAPIQQPSHQPSKPWEMKWEQPPTDEVPSLGVTIAPKGGTAREATPEEAKPYITGNILPLARNQNTGGIELAIPQTLRDIVSAPKRAYTGELQVQSFDPATGETGFTPQAIGEALNFGSIAAPEMRGAVPVAETMATRTTPTTETLKAAANAAYRQADDAGLVVKPDSFRKAVIGSLVAAKRAGIDPTLHPKATAALKRLAGAVDEGSPQSLQNLDTLRQVVKDAAASPDTGERRIAQILVGRIDDYLGGLTPKDVQAGDSKAAVQAIKQARELWARTKKSETLDDIKERALNAVGANYSAAQLQTALRQQFRSLANNKAKMRSFNAAEQTAIKQIVRGASLENMLRYLGKFAPNSPMSLLIGGGAGYAAGGPVGSAALMGAGTIARALSTKMQEAKINKLGDLVRGQY